MNPGRELDMLVAEKVMQWRCETLWSKLSGEYIGKCENYGRACAQHCPSYSTDIADAWEVVEKLQPRWVVNISCLGDHLVTITGMKKDIEQKRFQSHEYSAPHAICLAALNTLEEGK